MTERKVKALKMDDGMAVIQQVVTMYLIYAKNNTKTKVPNLEKSI